MARPRQSLSLFVRRWLLWLWHFSALCNSTNEEGLDFLEDNKGKPGVISLPSGLQYKVIKQGLGEFRLKNAEQKAKVQYLGTRTNHEPYHLFGDDAPQELAPHDVIGGWKEALMMMVEGDKWELYIPTHLSEQLGTKYEGNALIFDMEMIEITGEKVNYGEKELAYKQKIQGWELSKVEAEFDRLLKMARININIKYTFNCINTHYHQATHLDMGT